jgi:hypothetical protein
LNYVIIFVPIIYVASWAAFYFRMRKVGKMLGSSYTTRMNAALSLAVIIPRFLSLMAWGGETRVMVIATAVVISLAAGLYMIPSILMNGIASMSSTLDRYTEIKQPTPSFDERVKEVMERQRKKRQAQTDTSKRGNDH